MDYVALLNEIQTDPTAQGYAPFVVDGADNRIASLMNANTLARVDRVTHEEFMLWLVATGAAGEIDVAARGTNAVAKGAIGVQYMSRLDSIPVGAARVQTILSQMVSQGWITAGQKTALETTATVGSSRAYLLFGQSVTDADIAKALGR